MGQQATTRLSAGAVHLLAILAGYCAASARTRGEAVAFVSQGRLCERLQRSPAAVKRYVAELRAAGLIQVTRGYRALNRYTVSPEMSPSNGSEVSPSNGSEVSPSNGSEVSPSNGSEVSRSHARPIRGDLEITQLHQTAAAAAADAHAPHAPDESAQAAPPAQAVAPAQPAAWSLFPGKSALEVLTAAGLTEAVALGYAQADAGGLCHLAAAYYAERAGSGRCTLGLLRDMLAKPAEYFRADAAGNWHPPRDSMIYKNMHAAKEAQKRADERLMDKWRAEQKARDEAEADKRAAAQLSEDAAAWAALPAEDRRAIENGVSRELPQTMTREPYYPNGKPTQYRLGCYRWMRHLLAAQEQQAAWQALTDTERGAIEAEARKRFPLWASAPDALRSACLTIMANRAQAAQANRASYPRPK